MLIKVLDKKIPDTLVVPLVQDDGLAERLADIAAQAGCDAAALHNDFRADAKEVFLLYGQGKRKFYLVGLGKKNGLPEMQAALRSFCHRFKTRLPLQISVDLRHFPTETAATMADAAVSGILLGLYKINQNAQPGEKTAAAFGDAQSALNILVLPASLAATTAAAQRGKIFANVTQQILALVNAPGNHKTPVQMADFAKKAGKESGFSVKTMFREALEKEGMGGLLAVNQGSPNEPVLLLLEYWPKGTQKKAPGSLRPIGLVGKGVTFDTGGISIKGSTNMHYMKSDMGGAAAVLGTFMVAAQIGLQVPLVGVIPATENMVDGLSAKPGDVFTTYSGKTIEITDTDAEGRVILADALAYIVKNEQPAVLIDLATLTGSIIRAIGIHAGGLFTQNDALAVALATAGERTGERLWRMPMWDDYGTDLKSDVADLRNFTGKPMAESISAAKFLEHFTEKHPAWAHLDIAGMAFGDSEFASGKSATGYGVRLLIEFLEQWKGKRTNQNG